MLGADDAGDRSGLLDEELRRSFLRRALVADLRDDGRLAWMKMAGALLDLECEEEEGL